LEDAHARLTAAADRGMEVGPAGEWLLDNYHVVQDHIAEVRESLPRGYYRELPELGGGPLAGYPRVYEIAITLISHSEGRIGLDNVTSFVAAISSNLPSLNHRMACKPSAVFSTPTVAVAMESSERRCCNVFARSTIMSSVGSWVRSNGV
jgi:hypothetical protein